MKVWRVKEGGEGGSRDGDGEAEVDVMTQCVTLCSTLFKGV